MMKITKLFLSFFGLGLLYSSALAFQQDGFSAYQEDSGEVQAQCGGQCIILGDTSFNFNTREIVGDVAGQGVMAVGLLQGTQFRATKQRNIQDTVSFDEKITLNRTENPAVIVFQGNIQLQGLELSQRNLGGSEKLSQNRKQFRAMDTYKPYTINLLYGPKINGKSALTIFYWLLFIALVIILLKKRPKYKQRSLVIIAGAIAILIYDIRMGMEINNYYIEDLKSYIGQEDQSFRDRGDLYQFMDEVKLGLENLKIETDDKSMVSFYSDLKWPVPGSMRYFLYPYTFSSNEYSDTTKAFVLYGPSAKVQITNDTFTIDGQPIPNITIKKIRSGFLIYKS